MRNIIEYVAGKYDVIVIGAGHAGCEGALASARMGCQTLLVTLNLDKIGNMPCNPSVGGPAKGHLVREIDALGGQMALTADDTSLQARMLNTGKGPAVHALRVQSDKRAYHLHLLKTVLQQDNLTLVQALVQKLLIADHQVCGIVTNTGARFLAESVILTGGTYLRSRIIIGEAIYDGGPTGDLTSSALSLQLQDMDVQLGRFKTGTPPRIHKNSVDYSKFALQCGDEVQRRFSFMPTESLFWGSDPEKQLPCWLGYTTEEGHQIIRENLDRAPLYTGVVEGIGPRYCPSIEDKVVRFAERKAHQLFLEPEGFDSEELYVAGMSTSLPEEIQQRFFHSIPGLEKAKILRPGYAIEYDYVKPFQLSLTLELKDWPGLFTAGQINGTSGYEEAAAQGLLAGINAALKVRNKEAFILRRSDGYLGVLIDDLVNKEIKEPYRLLTSRAEYRLLLRQDNADLRLTPKGREIGLVSDERWNYFQKKKMELETITEMSHNTFFSNMDIKVGEILAKAGSTSLRGSIRAEDLFKRPEINFQSVLELMPQLKEYQSDTVEEAVIQLKYEGYISKQLEEVERFNRLEERLLPQDLDFNEVRGLSNEARQRLFEVRPLNLGQASRISGVNPADISVLLIFLEQKRRMSGSV
ncbi:tRNA uridine 5-carboxymethylaminomethyl modification enzyme mnmG [Syntrophobotulus glycolicus DSM 8271]|uniref:tRNA uridine 5-carboxymethylaminomethyl modification enzyme MnmG n=1 Tax=Syntrophobotulus glycolicus (strain DSM 8271 / FlGlyR) TaxID=645991 RepID=F0T2Y9_SYNGF|nr:tRNA uridine 5-carboxymethylaminomethyl modification enzyme mnmG [Syntrophobotulus glycolicus DSM 8271]